MITILGPTHTRRARFVGSTDSSFPAWRPPVGEKANVSFNTISDVNPNIPAIQGVEGQQGVFDWSGMTYARYFGALGSLQMSGGGHGAYYGNEVYNYDAFDRLWSRLTEPHTPLFVVNGWHGSGLSSTGIGGDEAGEFWADAGGTAVVQTQPTSAHFFGAVQYLPPGYGGAGAGGALITGMRPSVSPGGSRAGQRTHSLDLANPTWARFSANNLTRGLTWGSGTLCVALQRNKLYMSRNGRVSALDVLDFSTDKLWGSLTLTGGIVSGHFDGTLCYIASLDLLFWHVANGTTSEFKVIDPDTGVVYAPGLTGTVPNERGNGEWVEEFGTFFWKPSGGSDLVYRIVPSASPTTQPWTSTTEAVLGETSINAQWYPSSASQHFSRFRWAPPCGCFLWLPAYNQPVQAWRLQGT